MSSSGIGHDIVKITCAAPQEYQSWGEELRHFFSFAFPGVLIFTWTKKKPPKKFSYFCKLALHSMCHQHDHHSPPISIQPTLPQVYYWVDDECVKTFLSCFHLRNRKRKHFPFLFCKHSILFAFHFINSFELWILKCKDNNITFSQTVVQVYSTFIGCELNI